MQDTILQRQIVKLFYFTLFLGYTLNPVFKIVLYEIVTIQKILKAIN